MSPVCTMRRLPRCKWCGYPGGLLCDYPVMRNGKAGTCDAKLCRRCATAIAVNMHYCPPHSRLMQKAS